MSLDALHQQGTDQALRAMGSLPAPPAAPSERSAWRAVPAFFQGVAAGVVEAAAGLEKITRVEPTDPNRPVSDLRRQEQERWEQRYGDRTKEQVLRDAAHGLRPDPATAGTAERIVFDASRVVTKATGHVATAGPYGGAALLAGDETLAAADELQRQGVDRDTALKAGAVQGAAAGVGVVLPIVGSTAVRTVGLYALGGPGAFMAQQAATSEILERANYGELAQQYDPLDPTGLAVSALFPLPFAGMGLRANLRAKVPQQHVDAAMTENLTIHRDRDDALPIDEVVRRIDDGARAVDQEMAARRVDVPPEPVPEAAPGALAAEEAPAATAGAAEATGAPAAGDMGAAIASLDEQPALAAALPDDIQALGRSVATRIAEVERMVPDMVVRTGDDGRPVTVADEMARIRREVSEGTADELGAADAGLLEVAANCALSLG